MSVRNATERDIPDLRSILLTGLPSDHIWKYCFPLGQGGAVQLVDDALRLWLGGDNDKNRWLVTVSDNPDTGKPVSLAVWSLPGSAEDTESGKGGDFVAFQSRLSHAADSSSLSAGETATAPTKHEISSAARLAAVAEAVQLTTRGASGPLLSRYGPQMVLVLTATHPSHRFRGHARRLVAHGLALAASSRRGQVPVSVSALAGPMGYIFFSGLRFSDCGLVTVRVPGEREELDLKVMVQPAPPGRRSFSRQLLGLFGGGGGSGNPADAAAGRNSPALGGRRASAFEERKRGFDRRKLSAA